MSDVTTDRTGGGEDAPTFPPLAVALMLAIGILGFAATLLLGAYAPDLDGGRDAGGHALSDAAIGYSGLVRLMEATGRHPRIVRDDRGWPSERLLIATPESGTVDMSKLLARRSGRATLLVMPKWQAARDPERSGWVRIKGPLPAIDPAAMLAPAFPLTVARRRGTSTLATDPDLPAAVRFPAPRLLQVIAAAPSKDGKPRLQPILGDGHGGIVLGQVDGSPLYLLADPDLLDNAGMKDAHTAAAALALLDWLSPTGETMTDFDVTLNGVGYGRSPLRLLFDPPFLAATLAIVTVLALLGIQAFGRFGAPRPQVRAVAFGKAALVDNSAAMVRKAGRAHRLGGRYAAVARDRAVRAFGIPPRLQGAALDAYLDGLGGSPGFGALAETITAADSDRALVAAARALHAWQSERRV